MLREVLDQRQITVNICDCCRILSPLHHHFPIIFSLVSTVNICTRLSLVRAPSVHLTHCYIHPLPENLSYCLSGSPGDYLSSPGYSRRRSALIHFLSSTIVSHLYFTVAPVIVPAPIPGCPTTFPSPPPPLKFLLTPRCNTRRVHPQNPCPSPPALTTRGTQGWELPGSR